jgi:hypothetical protein
MGPPSYMRSVVDRNVVMRRMDVITNKIISLICDKSVTQLKICAIFGVIATERKACSCTSNRYSVITQFAKLAAGEQLCRRWHSQEIIAL